MVLILRETVRDENGIGTKIQFAGRPIALAVTSLEVSIAGSEGFAHIHKGDREYQQDSMKNNSEYDRKESSMHNRNPLK